MTNTSKKRFSEITICRGIGIILVVLGHAFPDGSTGNGISIPFWAGVSKFIYSFHMPLFFLLSGFVSTRMLNTTKTADKLKYCRDRFVRLMVPYFFFAVIYAPLKVGLSEYANNSYNFDMFWRVLIGQNPYGGLWFLYQLFLISVIFVFVLPSVPIRYIPLVGFLCVSCSLVFTLPPLIRDLCYYGFFVILGISLRNSYEKLRSLIGSREFLAISSLLLIVGNYFIDADRLTTLRPVVAVFGVAAVLSMALIINRQSGVINRMLTFLGDYAMDIYIISGPVQVIIRIIFWSRLALNYHIYTLIAFLGGVVLSLLVSMLFVRKFKLTRALILGDPGNVPIFDIARRSDSKL